MKGKLLLVTGYFGAGKSTLVKGICARLPQADHFTTVTTRPPREDEVPSSEYHHVDKLTYETMRSKSEVWDHGEMDGYYFGQDIAKAQGALLSGKSLVRVVGPDASVIRRIVGYFPDDAVIIWIDTPLNIANERLLASNDETRRRRVANNPLQNSANGKKIKSMADYTFKPTNVIDEDIHNFERFVAKIIGKEQ